MLDTLRGLRIGIPFESKYKNWALLRMTCRHEQPRQNAATGQYP